MDMSKEICNPQYLAKARLLKGVARERTLSRMGGKLSRRLGKQKLTALEALAIQLEIEDAQLAKWREKTRAAKIEAQKKKAKAAQKTAGKSKAPTPKKVVRKIAKPTSRATRGKTKVAA
jgi:septal ring factor EnvC (AmiA/AmiB activator)